MREKHKALRCRVHRVLRHARRDTTHLDYFSVLGALQVQSLDKVSNKANVLLNDNSLSVTIDRGILVEERIRGPVLACKSRQNSHSINLLCHVHEDHPDCQDEPYPPG